MGFFDFGDPFGTDFAGQVEIDRFVFIDKQLYGLMSVFGNGVISGWEITAETNFSISVSEGYGNINFIAGRTEFPATITDLPPNSVTYIYAQITQRSRLTESVEFITSPLPNINDLNFLLLGSVTTGPLSIESIDNTLRQEIGFIELIRAAIQQHKHRGGSLNPSKIDLSSEVKGQLPSFRIADFDAEKVTTGTFDLARMPLIDHQELQNVGLLTHAQLDTFIKTLESSNKELFGEISTANLLQLLIALKFIYDDPNSSFYTGNRLVDENWINSFAVIPGITPNSFIDFDASSAEIDLTQHYIKGIAPTTGTSFYVNYDTALAWNSSYLLENLTVVSNYVTLGFREDDESNIVTIEGFESATAQNENLSALFRKETVLRQDNASVTANAQAANVTEGFWSGKFKHQQTFRTQFVKEFTEPQNWSTYDSFTLHVKCLDQIHGAVKIYFVSSTDEISIDYVILEQNEVTENADPMENGFEQRIVSLSTIPFRDKVKKFVIYTDDLENPFSFYIDYITIQRAVLLPDEGTLKLRYASGSNVTFAQIEWDTIEPSGTDLTVRARSASGTVFLPRSDWTPVLVNGESINLTGTDLEIEIKFYPNDERTDAPVLNSVRVLIVTQAEIDGFLIDTSDEFGRGSSQNTRITTSPTSIALDTPIYVDSYYFAESNRINQGHAATATDGSRYMKMDNVFMDGAKTPIAPNTVFAAIESGSSNRVNRARLFEPRSVLRLTSRTFVVADTYNDRILEFDETGALVGGFGSVGYEHSSKTFPIAGCVDVRTGILYVVWSRKVDFKTVDVGKIALQSTSDSIRLVRDFDKIMGLTTSELESVNAQGQILPIHLSLQNAALAENLPSDNGAYMFIDETAVAEMTTDSVFYRAIVTELGIPLFVGNFAYIDGVFSPTWVEKLEDGSFTIGNATVAIKEWAFPESVSETITRSTNVSDIIIVDQNHNLTFGKTGVIEFSPFVPGRAERIGTNRLLLGGLRPGGQDGEPQESREFNFRTVGGSAENRDLQKKTLRDIFFGGSIPHVGAVVIYDIRGGATVFEYRSAEGMVVSDVDIDPTTGYYVVAESSLDRSGRIIKLDAGGNIVFSSGEGTYNFINDITMQYDGSMVVST